jgi:hypothetical protein
MLVGADKTTLEDAEKPLNRVGRDFAARIFVFGMIDRLMVGKMRAGSLIDSSFIRHEF